MVMEDAAKMAGDKAGASYFKRAVRSGAFAAKALRWLDGSQQAVVVCSPTGVIWRWREVGSQGGVCYVG